MSSSFSSIVRYCEDLQQAGVLAPRYKRLFQAFTLKVQAELNHQNLEAVDKIELADWGRFGKVRGRWEKYLKGEDTNNQEKSKKTGSARVKAPSTKP